MGKEKNIPLALVCLFGWLLSFPFSGPILENLSLGRNSSATLALIFIGFHGLSLLVAGFITDEEKAWRSYLQIGALICIVGHSYLLLTGFAYFPQAAMAAMGTGSALFVLGWSRPYSFGVPPELRIRTMAGIIIASNMIFFFHNLALVFLSANTVLLISLLPLLGSLWISRNIEEGSCPDKEPGPLPVMYLSLVTIFILIIYINGGFLYNLVYRAIDPLPTSHYFRVLAYIFVLAVMWVMGARIKNTVLVYLGASVMGIAFVLFALFGRSGPGSILTTLILEGSFGFIDLFTWTVPAAIAFAYSRSFRVFGSILSANIAAILCGYLLGEQMLLHEQYQIITGLFASALIFLAFLLLPWMRELVVKEDSPPLLPAFDGHLREMPFIDALTPREVEILASLLEGHSNKTIARLLHISENTLKTHLKSIYAKLGISHKRELFSLISNHQDGA